MAEERPNFVVFLADDQGYGDAGCFGASDLATPNLDRIAAEGARFTQWYGGAPVCSASRAALLTGRWPASVNVPRNVPPDGRGLAPDAPTLPERLRAAGYQTLMSGKWHLGQEPGEWPHERGFDDFFGFLHGCVDYYSHVFYWLLAGGHPARHDLWHNDEELFLEGCYVTDLIAERAVAQLERAKADGRPFFLYVPFNAPHYPMHGPASDFAPFADLPEARRLMAGMMASYDRAVGRILEALDRLQLAGDTCVLASSDHGPSREPRNWPDGRNEPFPGGSSGGLRGAKFSLCEGGIRVPAVMRFPGRIAPGTVYDAPAGHVDAVPTLLALAGVDPPAGDGRDLSAALMGAAGAPEDRFFFFGDENKQAVRRGDWKLVLGEPDNEGAPFLAHLGEDPAEERNCIEDEAAVRDELVARIDETLARMGRERTARAPG